MTARVTVRALAKLNLWLHVIAREANGYHGIETLFHRIDLADDVSVALTPPGERTIACSADVGPAHTNLAYLAAQLYCASLDWTTGFHIQITKRIPTSGGLGGGSADAAATLLALNAMSPRTLNDAELAELGSQLGADVPFLLTDAPMALAWGHGDRLLNLPALPQRHVALLVPEFGMSTSQVYQSLGPVNSPHRGQLSLSDLGSWANVVQLAQNDLERSPVVLSLPSFAVGIGALRAAGSIMAAMTGSGSVLFGIFDSEPDAEALKRATGCKVVLTRTALNVEAVHRLE